VEKEKYELFTEVLKRLDKAGVLGDLMIAGSWNIFLYEEYFGKDAGKIPPIRTIDVDFLVPRPSRMINKIDLPEALKDLGYIPVYKGDEGFKKLLHPDLLVEFIVHEKGKGVDNNPVLLPFLNMNAPALRFMDVLYDNMLTVTYEGMKVKIAHPAALAFHYLIINKRRKNKEKAEKNFEHAVAILNLIIEKGRMNEIKEIFNKLHKNRHKEIIEILRQKGQSELLIKIENIVV
jgi:hypothetical protein